MSCERRACRLKSSVNNSCSLDLQDTNWNADLPLLPIPELRATMVKYLASLQAILRPQDSLLLLNSFLQNLTSTSADNAECKEKQFEKKHFSKLVGLSIGDDELTQLATQYENTRALVDDFLRFEGPQLQRDLKDYASKCANWATDFWLNDMYLSIRLPLPVNSNPFFLFPRQVFATSGEMLVFATRVIEFSVRFKFRIDQQTLSQDLGSGQGKGKWLCMETYKHFFHSYRMPHTERDKLLPQSRRSNHIVVASCNQFFVLYLGDEPLEDPYSCDPNVATLPSAKIYQQLARIYRVSRQRARAIQQPKLGLLTGEQRQTWAHWHKQLTCEMQIDNNNNQLVSSIEARRQNRESLAQIEDCLFVMCLDSDAFVDDDDHININTNSNDISVVDQTQKKDARVDAANVILTGGGSSRFSANRWFDKFLQVIVGRSGICGINIEHSASEGMTVLRFVNEFFDYLKRCSLMTGNSVDELDELAIETQSALQSPTGTTLGVDKLYDDNTIIIDPNNNANALKWNLNDELLNAIKSAQTSVDELVDDFSLVISEFEHFGRDFIKAQNMSPDAFVQLALQFTYFKCHGRLVSTYESGSLRQFKYGRVDNIRANSLEALAWIQAMLLCDESSSSCGKNLSFAQASTNTEIAAALFKRALDKQVTILRYTINGAGPDNHLLALRELSADRFDDLPSLFSDKSYGDFLRFKLSTSQLPNESGVTVGYGAVVPDGYGCSYNPQRERIVFCVSSFNACKQTDGEKFAQTLTDCLLKMQQLCRLHFGNKQSSIS